MTSDMQIPGFLPERAPVSKKLTRAVKLRTRGTPMGPIVRLVSPTDLGDILKPFVFLDLADIPPNPANAMRWHPHSGIATLTIVLDGQNEYRETTGVHGGLSAGGIEWMRSGRGVWHTASAVGSRNLKGFQVWLLLPPGEDLAEPRSTYLTADQVPVRNSKRLILGSWDGMASALDAPADTTLVDAVLKVGERWTYESPAGQEMCWAAVYSGAITISGIRATQGDLLVFEDSPEALMFYSEAGAGFIIGSARRSPHSLHIGRHSVHVSAEALAEGEAEIAAIARRLMQQGVLA